MQKKVTNHRLESFQSKLKYTNVNVNIESQRKPTGKLQKIKFKQNNNYLSIYLEIELTVERPI